jgi:predicted glycosyltransferase
MDVQSTEYRRVLVAVTDEDGDTIVPTAFPVSIAFVADGVLPESGDWHSATWVTASGRYYARILVGPDGGVNLSESDYHVYVRVDAGVEFPYMLCGYLNFR